MTNTFPIQITLLSSLSFPSALSECYLSQTNNTIPIMHRARVYSPTSLADIPRSPDRLSLPCSISLTTFLTQFSYSQVAHTSPIPSPNRLRYLALTAFSFMPCLQSRLNTTSPRRAAPRHVTRADSPPDHVKSQSPSPNQEIGTRRNCLAASCLQFLLGLGVFLSLSFWVAVVFCF